MSSQSGLLLTERAETRHIAVIAAPKSASTFVYRVLAHLTEYEPITTALLSTHNRILVNEADLQLADKLATSSKSFIFREHLLPNPNTLEFLARSRARLVVITRNFEDTIVSLMEEWERQWLPNVDAIKADGYHVQFCGTIPYPFVRKFVESTRTERLDQTIDAAMPWLSQFVSGWKSIFARSSDLGLPMDYETIRADAPRALRTACGYLFSDGSKRIEDDRITASVQSVLSDRIDANFNIGKSGRGREELNRAQLKRIARVKQSFTDERVPDLRTRIACQLALPRFLGRN
jgi:hypothetical protein